MLKRLSRYDLAAELSRPHRQAVRQHHLHWAEVLQMYFDCLNIYLFANLGGGAIDDP